VLRIDVELDDRHRQVLVHVQQCVGGRVRVLSEHVAALHLVQGQLMFGVEVLMTTHAVPDTASELAIHMIVERLIARQRFSATRTDGHAKL
tara:strand:+ start:198 stop:470 length:273 start_codon:yes stop_codon:yes gene_type:complete